MLSGIGWGVGQLIVWQCNAGSLQCQSNFLPFRRFCSVTNFFSLSCRNGRRQDKNPEEADCKKATAVVYQKKVRTGEGWTYPR